MADDVEGDRVVSLPLEEHTPMTVAEAGLVLDAPRPAPRAWWVAGALGLVLVVAVGVGVVVSGDDPTTTVVDLAPGTCFAPVVTEVAEPVDTVDCSPGTARVVQKVPAVADVGEPYPGAGALTLVGQGACQAAVDADRLVVAVPSSAGWAAGDRTVVCTERQ